MKECPTCSLCFDDEARFCQSDGSQLVESLAENRELDGRWRLNRIISVGRQGAVYEATDVAEKRHAIVKTLLPTLFLAPGALESFLHDVGLLVSLRHPNIASVYTAGRLSNGGAYIASEFIDGESLKEILVRDGRFSVADTVAIGAALADALDTAHAGGVLHRDVKPDNIMLTEQDGVQVPKLVDFKPVRLAHVQGGSAVTATGSLVVRLPHYSSPEQCRGEQPDDCSDIYSLGIVLYEMLAGKRPFDAPSPMAVVVQHVTDAPKPLSEFRSDVPAIVERAILRALAKAKADRPHPAAIFARMLRETVGAKPGTGRLIPPGYHVAGAAVAPPPPPKDDAKRRVPPPPQPLSMMMTIVDADDEKNTSRKISGVVRDVSENGMRIETGTVMTGQLNIIRDHTTAFKNRLEIEVQLPDGPVRISGFAAWYKPAPDGMNWNAGVYIRDMPSADRTRYNAYIQRLIEGKV